MYHGTKFHTNSVKPRRNRRERKGLFSCVPSPFYRVCMGFCASVTVSASVSVASVNQALGIHPGGWGTPYIQMIGMIIVFFMGCNRRFGILRGHSSKIL